MYESELMRYILGEAKEKNITTKKELSVLAKKIDKKQILTKKHLDLVSKVVLGTN